MVFSVCGASLLSWKKRQDLTDRVVACAVVAVFIACSCLRVQSCAELRPLCIHQAQLKAEWVLLNTQDALPPFFSSLHTSLLIPVFFLQIFSFFLLLKETSAGLSFPPSLTLSICVSFSLAPIMRAHLTWLIDIWWGIYRGNSWLWRPWLNVNLFCKRWQPLLKEPPMV